MYQSKPAPKPGSKVERANGVLEKCQRDREQRKDAMKRRLRKGPSMNGKRPAAGK